MTNALFIVSTPIGNLDDMSFRAVETLKTVDLILAEDTRHFKRLAERYQITTRVESYHDHSERGRAPGLVEKLVDGLNIALVSDAGTPLVNDPGYHLVKLAKEKEVRITPIPGASSILAALVVSGFESDSFYFGGFLAPKDGKRRSAIREAWEAENTAIFLESPHRILKSLKAVSEECEGAEVCVARELTKLHEEVLSGAVSDVMEELASRPKIRGEIVLVLRRRPKKSKKSKEKYSAKGD
ncbi:UNVERIFIED_CONTAM: hypothetical protein GTU68_061629 [Idotea baltica]|nr:hypothetical protein [Idotea baltica]